MKQTLRQIWESQGLWLAEVARQAEISDTTLRRMLYGQEVTEAVKSRVCRVLKIERSSLDDRVIAEKRSSQTDIETN